MKPLAKKKAKAMSHGMGSPNALEFSHNWGDLVNYGKDKAEEKEKRGRT